MTISKAEKSQSLAAMIFAIPATAIVTAISLAAFGSVV